MNLPHDRKLFATLGTDHHTFDRLMGWLDRWLEDHADVAGMIQYGHSRAPARAHGVSMMPREKLLEHLSDAFVVVTHGGTGSIMEARSRGHVPVVVPRVAGLNEHVDDHQVNFCRKLADLRWIHLAEKEVEFRRHLDLALIEESGYRTENDAPSRMAAADNLGAVLGDAMRMPAGSVSLRRLGHMVRYVLRGRAERVTAAHE